MGSGYLAVLGKRPISLTKKASTGIILVAALFFCVSIAGAGELSQSMAVSDLYGKLPLSFEKNQGQTGRTVDFLSRGPGYALFLSSSEAVFSVKSAGPAVPKPLGHAERSLSLTHLDKENRKTDVSYVHMRFLGADANASAFGEKALPGKVNYLKGKNPSEWRTNVPTYEKVRYREVYDGIDLVYYGNQSQLEYDFVVAPGADPSQIAFVFNVDGEGRLDKDIEIGSNGDLILHTSTGDICLRKPIVYQQIEGRRQSVDGQYSVGDDCIVSFTLSEYDRTLPLVIDPVVLIYSTYVGGALSDQGVDIAVDEMGNAYITCWTDSSDIPVSAGAVHSEHGVGGSFDVFVAKLNSEGTKLEYSAYIGGTEDDLSIGIAVDGDGSAYVTGWTKSDDFPVTSGAFQAELAGGSFDVFVLKLDSTGSSLEYSTYLGGAVDDSSRGIALDDLGNAYVVGATNSSDFPVSSGAFQEEFGGGEKDGFVTKLNSEGTDLEYSTYLGDESLDLITAVAVDDLGYAYITGATDSTGFPTTDGAFQSEYAGGDYDAFVAKLDTSGSSLQYSTFLGGEAGDQSTYADIDVDEEGNAFVVGATDSLDFPVSAEAFQVAFAGGLFDTFAVKLNSTGTALEYATYLGGAGDDPVTGIAVGVEGSAYVVGKTDSVNFPLTDDALQTQHGEDGASAFVLKLNSTGSALEYSTLLGGALVDGSLGVAVDEEDVAYIVGTTTSRDFPTTPGAFQSSYKGGAFDAFVTKLSVESPSEVYVAMNFGDDDTGNGLRLTPWKTIAFALERVAVTATADHPVTIFMGVGAFEEQVQLIPHVRLVGVGEKTIIQYHEIDSFVVAGAQDTVLQDCTVTVPHGILSETDLLRIEDASMEVINVVFDGKDSVFATGIRISGADSSDSEIRDSVIRGVKYGIRASDTGVKITRNLFEAIWANAVYIPASSGATAAPMMGDATDTFSGWNRFKDVGGFIINNLDSSNEVMAEVNDWGSYTKDAIRADLLGPVDFDPWVGKDLAPGTLVGRVVDEEEGTLIPLVLQPRIEIAGESELIVPDENGKFSVGELSEGSYLLRAGAMGYVDSAVVAFEISPKEIAVVVVGIRKIEGGDEIATDIDGDGIVNAVDVQLVVNGALGIDIAPFDADVNSDGEVNAVDAQLVINAALGL